VSDPVDPNAPRRIADAEGGMELTPLVYALVHALDRAITGEMVFHAPTGEAHSVTFFEGAAVRVEPGADGDRIGDDLVAMDHLREEDLADGLAMAHSSRRRLGELLVLAGAVDPAALTHALTLQSAKRLALLANLAPTSTFSLYFSARAEPEPYAPWAPLDLLLATIRAWEDRSRLHGTLKWLANKPLSLCIETNLETLMLTSREKDAIALMRRDAPSLRTLYATVGKGLSSLLYMLAVTRQFTFTSAKGKPMGQRKESSLVSGIVQIAVPIAPVIAHAPEVVGDTDEVAAHVEPPPEPPPAPEAAPVAKTPLRAPPRPSFSPPKLADAPKPPSRVAEVPASGASMSLDFRLAEAASKRLDYTTADEILRERCTDEDADEPDFQALAAWVKANVSGDLTTPLNDLTFLLMSHHGCESALYYRGLLLKRSGKEKAALRDFVVLVKQNPTHVGALTEIKLIREGKKG
jgi:hypothetical protein